MASILDIDALCYFLYRTTEGNYYFGLVGISCDPGSADTHRTFWVFLSAGRWWTGRGSRPNSDLLSEPHHPAHAEGLPSAILHTVRGERLRQRERGELRKWRGLYVFPGAAGGVCGTSGREVRRKGALRFSIAGRGWWTYAIGKSIVPPTSIFIYFWAQWTLSLILKTSPLYP